MLQSVNDVNLAKFLDFDAPWPELCRSGLWLLGSDGWQVNLNDLLLQKIWLQCRDGDSSRDSHGFKPSGLGLSSCFKCLVYH